MTSQTEHYAFTKLDAGESVHAGNGKFPNQDRDTLDQILYGLANHRHTGAASTGAPTVAPDLTASSTGGTIPAGTLVRYCYTYTDPATGETTPSPVAEITTPAAIAAPDAPTASIQAIGGTLVPGQYFYAVSAYQGETTVETKALNSVAVTVPAGTSTNEITLTLPALPAGATGFNVYRRAPGESAYYFLETAAGPTYVDQGTAATTRNLPAENTTNSTYSIEVALPGATPAIPAGYSWTIYRSYTSSFLSSRLVTLDESTLTYDDVGNGTMAASPPSATAGSTPEKVDLTDGAEVQGALPDTMVAVDDTVLTNLTGTTLAEILAVLDASALKSAGWELNGQTADKTLAAYTADAESTPYGTTLTDPTDAPATADALRDDLVANAFPQIRTAMTNLNNLRVAYENLRAAHEDLRALVAAIVAVLDDGT